MNRIAVFFALVALLIVCSSNAFAADTRLRSKLSQLDFDKGTKNDSIDKALKEAAAHKLTEFKKHQRNQLNAPQTPTVGEKSITVEKHAVSNIDNDTEADQQSTELVPHDKGPDSDKSNSHAITTTASWKPKKNGSCANPKISAQMCNKAKAVKELLHRFTGSNEIYETQCKRSNCNGTKNISTLVSLSVVDTQGGSFKLIKDKASRCKYLLTKAKKDDWATLEVGRLTCTCLPESCNGN